MSYSRSKTKPARVGDMVAFDYGGGLTVTGKVVEDRGHIGVGGRRLVRVRVEIELDAEPMFIELPDEALMVVKHVSEPMRRVGACEACGKDTSWIVGASPTCSAPCAERYEALRRLRDPEPFTDSRLGFNLQNIKRRPT